MSKNKHDGNVTNFDKKTAEQAPKAKIEEAAPTKALEEQLAAKDALIAEQNDKYMRVLAEYDNFRKRSAKERESLYGNAVALTAASFLPVLDNLERAAKANDADEGIAMIVKQFFEVLERNEITPCGVIGDDFDPHLHNAVMHVDDDKLGENVIVEVMQKGYVMKDRLVRAAMVKTAN